MAKEETEVVYGKQACLAVLAKRPGDLLRVAYSEDMAEEIAPLTQFAAQKTLPMLVRDDVELERMADSTHHEGVCLQTKPRKWTTPNELAELLAHDKTAVVVALDRVRNPYNVGAILRTAAFFGAHTVILGSTLAPQAVRVAEGGAEGVRLTRTTDLVDTLRRLREKGIRIVGTDANAQLDASKAQFRKPMVLVMGNEREGLTERMLAQCDEVIGLRGSGAIESLNVAVAAGVLIARLTRA